MRTCHRILPQPLAFEGLKDLDPAADDQKDPENKDGGQSQPDGHAQPDGSQDHQQDALGQEPAPVVDQVPQHRIGAIAWDDAVPLVIIPPPKLWY